MTIDQQHATMAPVEHATMAPVEEVALDEEHMVARRITVGLIPRVRAELKSLMESTQYSLTDTVNRAVSIYFLVTAHRRAGYEMVFRHRTTGHERVVEIL